MSTRWNPLAGVAAVVLIVVAFSVGGSSPDTTEPDAKITSYFSSHSHDNQQIAAVLIFAIAVMLLITFFAVVRERLGGSPLIAMAGTASAVLLFLGVVGFAGPAFAGHDTSRFQLDANTYRLLNDMGFAAWLGGLMIGALAVWATSAAAWGVLPRWFTIAGFVVGATMLFGILWIPGLLYGLWVIGASILLTRRPGVAAAAVPQPA